ncbi:hypothetical protein PS15m_011554 [Mucor circinelloides]
MNLPHDEQRGLRIDIKDPNLPSTSKVIFKKTIAQRYEEREGPTEVQSLLLSEFVSYYYVCSTKKEKEKYEVRQKNILISPSMVNDFQWQSNLVSNFIGCCKDGDVCGELDC